MIPDIPRQLWRTAPVGRRPNAVDARDRGGNSLISDARVHVEAMASTFQKAVAFLLGAILLMMIMGPLASVLTWAIGWVAVLLVVPFLLMMALSFSRRRTEERGPDLEGPKGLTAEEWAEPTDPDDFEGEID
jgi:hypothetical protein